MFNEINEKMKLRMKYLENIDRGDRTDGTEKLRRLRQIPPETGKFLSLLASNCPDGNFIEIGNERRVLNNVDIACRKGEKNKSKNI